MSSPEPLANMLFPTESNSPNLSMVTTRATVLDVCYSVYGENTMSTDALDDFYETSASKSLIPPRKNCSYNSPHSSVSSYHCDSRPKQNNSDMSFKVMRILLSQLPHALSLVTFTGYLVNSAQLMCRDRSR